MLLVLQNAFIAIKWSCYFFFFYQVESTSKLGKKVGSRKFCFILLQQLKFNTNQIYQKLVKRCTWQIYIKQISNLYNYSLLNKAIQISWIMQISFIFTRNFTYHSHQSGQFAFGGRTGKNRGLSKTFLKHFTFCNSNKIRMTVCEGWFCVPHCSFIAGLALFVYYLSSSWCLLRSRKSALLPFS